MKFLKEFVTFPAYIKVVKLTKSFDFSCERCTIKNTCKLHENTILCVLILNSFWLTLLHVGLFSIRLFMNVFTNKLKRNVKEKMLESIVTWIVNKYMVYLTYEGGFACARKFQTARQLLYCIRMRFSIKGKYIVRDINFVAIFIYYFPSNPAGIFLKISIFSQNERNISS